jgi:hypothetical protein
MMKTISSAKIQIEMQILGSWRAKLFLKALSAIICALIVSNLHRA